MLKVQATAWLSESTSASAPRFSTSLLICLSFSASAMPAYCTPWTVTGAIGGGGRSCQTASTALLSTATSSAPALAQAADRRSAAAKVCSHGSNPRRSPAFRCADTQLSGGGSISDSTAQALASTCLAAWIV